MKIMLAYHGFSLDGRIVSTTLDHVKLFNAQLHLVTSMETGEAVPKNEFDLAEERLEKAKTFFLGRGVDCVTNLLETESMAGEDLVQFATSNEIDELIIGVRSRSKLGKLLFGSTAQHVILQAPCPVLAVKD